MFRVTRPLRWICALINITLTRGVNGALQSKIAFAAAIILRTFPPRYPFLQYKLATMKTRGRLCFFAMPGHLNEMVYTGDTEISLQTNSNSKCQDLPKFSFSGGGWETPDQHSWNTWVGALKEFWTQIHPIGASHCITDSLSHTTYVETKWNKPFLLTEKQTVIYSRKVLSVCKI